MLVAALGCGSSLPALMITALTDATAGLGSAVLSSAQQLGGAVGIAVLVTLATNRRNAADSLDPQQAATAGFSYAPTIAAAIVALGAVLIATMLRDRRPTGTAAS